MIYGRIAQDLTAIRVSDRIKANAVQPLPHSVCHQKGKQRERVMRNQTISQREDHKKTIYNNLAGACSIVHGHHIPLLWR